MGQLDYATPRSLWAQQVASAALELRGRLDLVADSEAKTHPAERELRGRVERLLDCATNTARASASRWPWPKLHEWWTGSRVEMCWSYLHEAEAQLADASDPGLWQATARSALAHAHRLPANDPERAALRTVLDEQSR